MRIFCLSRADRLQNCRNFFMVRLRCKKRRTEILHLNIIFNDSLLQTHMQSLIYEIFFSNCILWELSACHEQADCRIVAIFLVVKLRGNIAFEFHIPRRALTNLYARRILILDRLNWFWNGLQIISGSSMHIYTWSELHGSFECKTFAWDLQKDLRWTNRYRW